MAIIACICTRAGLSMHLQLANIIASKSRRGSQSKMLLYFQIMVSQFFVSRDPIWVRPIIFKPGLTGMTPTKRDPDDPNRFQRWFRPLRILVYLTLCRSRVCPSHMHSFALYHMTLQSQVTSLSSNGLTNSIFLPPTLPLKYTFCMHRTQNILAI